jgi:hypothetical protein
MRQAWLASGLATAISIGTGGSVGCGTSPAGPASEHAAPPGSSGPRARAAPPAPDASAAPDAQAALIALIAPDAATADAPAGPLCTAPAEPRPEDLGLSASPKRRATSDDACGVADNNLTRAEAAILALPVPARASAAPPWDHRSALARLPLITRRFGLDDDEQRRLRRDGLVAAARLAQPSYAWA